MELRGYARRAAVLLFVALATSARLPAQVVIDGGAPNQGIGWNLFDDNRAASSFTAPSAISFDAIRFWGLLPDGPAISPTMYWQILADDAGAPDQTSIVLQGSANATGVVRTELDAFPGFFSWQFDFSTGLQNLNSGIYWLVLHDGPLDVADFTGSNLVWENTDAPGTSAIQTFTVDDHWDVNPAFGEAFELRTSPVVTPEPDALVLVATGLLGVAGVVRMRRRRSC